MTHHTDTERAEFEAWAKIMRYLLDRMEDQPESYEEDNTNEAWRGWQAARRAPAVPVPQGWKLVPQRLTQDMADAAKCVDGRLSVWKYDDAYKAMLAAAPQPPEAAPVDFPEPSVVVICELEKAPYISSVFGISYGANNLYTEQQVRELLATHRIGGAA